MLDHLREEFGSIGVLLREILKIFVYHVVPMGTTTTVLIITMIGGLSIPIVIVYLYTVVFSCLLLAVSVISGK